MKRVPSQGDHHFWDINEFESPWNPRPQYFCTIPSCEVGQIIVPWWGKWHSKGRLPERSDLCICAP